MTRMTRMTRWAAVSVMILTAAACSSDKTAETTTTTTADTSTNGAATTVTTQTTTTTDGASMGAMPAGVTAEMVASGEKQFKGGPCIACHGADAMGTALAPNLTDNEWLNIDGSYEAIKTTIKMGIAKPKVATHVTPMPAMGGGQLSDQQVSEIAAYVYSLSHKG